MTVFPDSHNVKAIGADSVDGIEFSIRVDSASLFVTQINMLMLNLAAFLESFGLMNLELLDIGKGSLWQKIRASFSGNPDAASEVLDAAFESITEALQDKQGGRLRSPTVTNVSASTKMEAEAILKIAQAEKLQRVAC